MKAFYAVLPLPRPRFFPLLIKQVRISLAWVWRARHRAVLVAKKGALKAGWDGVQVVGWRRGGRRGAVMW